MIKLENKIKYTTGHIKFSVLKNGGDQIEIVENHWSYSMVNSNEILLLSYEKIE